MLTDVASAVDVVGLGIAEHLPWDALALQNMLTKLPLLGDWLPTLGLTPETASKIQFMHI
ncbi:hypothetical protein ALP66_04865 [Pseudomonas amygdali pv. photiniae]|uniref:Uncharacterized protein n=1 Tax=Pseudomonas amygdali pv. photiniae TaxID=251724 RepID=A0A658K5R9_PSEA0|nr:hypothetical protein ALP66_04865 [Pseudomonas amygdali pv. photiniae]